MLPERPTFPTKPCPACGRAVDPLRARRVLWLEDGVRFLCSDVCRARFLDGDRGFDAPSPPPVGKTTVERPSIPELVREATFVREPAEAASRTGQYDRTHDALVAAGLASLSLGIVAFTPSRELGWLAAFLLLLAAAVSTRVSLRTVRATPSLRVVAPVGLALAALGAAMAPTPEAQRWTLAGAAIAGIVLSIRTWVHASMAAPVRAVARELLDTLPSNARIPSRAPSAYEEIPTLQLRQGDLVVVLEDERAPADGVVEEGAGVGLRYPRAATARPYAVGDFILAGTRLQEGAITVRVRRTGRERAIVRAVELAERRQPDRRALSFLRPAVAQWSWVVLGPAALALLVFSGPDAAAALLLGIPVLGLIAGLDAPLEAGAVASARRGTLFGSARALHDGGRAKVTAILLRGALTAGEPIVQQVISVGPTDIDKVMVLAAATERSAEDHPIARAIVRYAEEEGLPRATVRKERLLAGLGVTAVTSKGVSVVVGRRQLLLDEGISVANADDDAIHIENEGLTPIFVAIDGTLEALVTILDPTHVGAPDAVRKIADLPCDVVILSGDDRRTVERIASQLGASRVKAPLLPHERVAEVRALRETDGLTAAIGRGGEDDAVLAAADLPISLRLVGTALEDRGVVVANRDVRDAAGALWIARAVRRSTWRTLGACTAISVLVVLGATTGWMTPVAAAFLALLTEAWSLRAGSRLLRRVDLRVPMRQ